MSSRVRLLVVLLVCSSLVSLVAVAVAVVAGVAAWRGSDAADDPPVGRAVVVEDLCAVVEPLVPSDLELGDGTPSNDTRGTTQRASCVIASSGDSELEVRVSSYALPEGDPHRTLDQLVGAACDTLEQQYGAGFAGEDRGCSGQDVEPTQPTVPPSPATAASIAAIPHLGATVTVTLTDRRTPTQVAAYASAITYGLVGSDLAS